MAIGVLLAEVKYNITVGMMRIIANFVTVGQKGDVMTQTANSVQPVQKHRVSAFRTWVRELWYKNCDEHFEMNQPRYTHEEYFNNFKWWLKREFRYQQDKEKKRDEHSRRAIPSVHGVQRDNV